MSSAPAGWYLDPTTGTNLRYWNGVTWTDEVALLSPAPTTPSDRLPHDTSPAASTALEPEVEQTQLTRRQLRALRGPAVIDDAPKHLPPVGELVPQPEQDPVEQVVIPAVTATEPGEAWATPAPHGVAPDPRQRRRKIVRLSVLLGILAIASSVAALTAGAL